jgi:hypothetical protein
MTSGRSILRAHGWFLAILGTLLFSRTIIGHVHGTGMFAFLADNDVAAIGFTEAYALIAFAGAALALGADSPRRRALHLLAAALHAFLTAINLNSWRFYSELNLGAVGYASTAMHVVLATVELICAARAPGPRVTAVRCVEA